jgi:hypothetical protein
MPSKVLSRKNPAVSSKIIATGISVASTLGLMAAYAGPVTEPVSQVSPSAALPPPVDSTRRTEIILTPEQNDVQSLVIPSPGPASTSPGFAPVATQVSSGSN